MKEERLLKLAERDLAEAVGWVIIHHRACDSSTCYFGPFASRDDAYAWHREHPEVVGIHVPMFKNVRWDRVL